MLDGTCKTGNDIYLFFVEMEKELLGFSVRLNQIFIGEWWIVWKLSVWVELFIMVKVTLEPLLPGARNSLVEAIFNSILRGLPARPFCHLARETMKL